MDRKLGIVTLIQIKDDGHIVERYNLRRPRDRSEAFVKALVYGKPGKKTLKERPKARVGDATDAIVRRQRIPGSQAEDAPPARNSDLEWDLIDETSFESFPASDPPGWISRRRTIESVRVSIRPEPAS